MSLQHTDEMRVCWSALCGVNKNKLPSVYCDREVQGSDYFRHYGPISSEQTLREQLAAPAAIFLFLFFYFSFEDGASRQLLSAPTRTKENMRLVWHA